MIQYPAISSFDSVKGPSTTVRFPPENLMRAPLELGCRPARSRSTPAFSSSSLYFPIADRSSSLGILPASESLFAFTIIMNRINATPGFWSGAGFRRGGPWGTSLYFNVERVPVKSTWDLLNIAPHEGAWTLLKLAPARPLESQDDLPAGRGTFEEALQDPQEIGRAHV